MDHFDNRWGPRPPLPAEEESAYPTLTPRLNQWLRAKDNGLRVEGEPNKAAKRSMIAWGFATLVPDENCPTMSP